MQASLSDFSTSGKGHSILTPSAVRTSAAPVLDDRARLPCLATGMSWAASTKLTAVETFQVPLASPPVPQVSMALAGAAMPWALARMAMAPPVSSSTVSPRTRSAIRNAPICDGVASPDIMMSKAVRASSTESSWRSATRPISPLKVSISLVIRLPSSVRQNSGSCRAGHVHAPRQCSPGGTGPHAPGGPDAAGP